MKQNFRNYLKGKSITLLESHYVNKAMMDLCKANGIFPESVNVSFVGIYKTKDKGISVYVEGTADDQQVDFTGFDCHFSATWESDYYADFGMDSVKKIEITIDGKESIASSQSDTFFIELVNNHETATHMSQEEIKDLI
jgi:hypothetical protein